MFDNLLNLVKEHAGEAIINNPAIPNEKNNEAIGVTTESIVDTLKAQISGGNLNSVLDMFKGGDPNTSSVGNAIQSNAATELMKKFGIDSAQASNLVSTLIPKVMSQFVNKTNDPGDNSFDLKSVMNSLGGDNAKGLLGNITNLFN